MDEHQLELTRFAREAALRRFGSARSTPMRPWISALTWCFPRLIAPVRRSFHAAFDVAKKLEKQGDFVSAVQWYEAANEVERILRCSCLVSGIGQA